MLFGWFSLSPQSASVPDTTLLAMRQAAGLANHQHQTEIVRPYCHFVVAQPDLLTQAQVPFYAIKETAERVLIAHGRVDDSDVLAQELQLNNAKNYTNPQVMLAAYEMWGEERVKQRLSGDWLIVDMTAERCIVLQCHQGYSSCYYQQQEQSVLFASRLPVIVAGIDTPLLPNLDRIARFMLAWHQGANNSKSHHTMYAGIFRVPCGHQFNFDKQGVSLSRYYWPQQEAHSPVPLNRTEAVSHIDKLLNQAIKSRVLKCGRIASMLSGGFDSSTVTIYAANQLLPSQQSLPTYSHVPAFPEFAVNSANEVGDEKPLIEDVIAMTAGLSPNFVDSADYSVFSAMQNTLAILGQPIHAGINSYWLLDIFEQSSLDGNTMLLSGEMGNATTSFVGIFQLQPFSQIYRQRGFLRAVKHKVVTPYLINPWRRLKKRLGIMPKFFFEFGYIRPELCEQLQFREKVKQLDFVQGISLPMQNPQDLMAMIFFAGDHPRGQLGSELSEYYGFMFSDPFSYRPLQQYMMSLPNEFYFDENGKGKAIIRQLMRDKLPTSILNASAKGRQSGDIGRRIEADFPAMAKLLEKMQRSDTVLAIIDMKKLGSDFNKLTSLPANRRSVLLCHTVSRACMLGMFLCQFDK